MNETQSHVVAGVRAGMTIDQAAQEPDGGRFAWMISRTLIQHVSRNAVAYAALFLALGAIGGSATRRSRLRRTASAPNSFAAAR